MECQNCGIENIEDARFCKNCGQSLDGTLTDSSGYLSDQLKADDYIIDGRFKILRKLGKGGMGEVFLAEDVKLTRQVAIKSIITSKLADPASKARFLREAQTASQLDHPNICTIYEIYEEGNHEYIVMQYVQGTTLTHWIIDRARRASQRETRRIIGEVASALAAAHARDLVHRDVKPSNVLIETESGRAFVADFGVSAAISPRHADETKLTATGAVVGTPAYMSPEQASADRITPKSDVYSLGVVAYELLVGEAPFQATTAMG